MPTRRSRTGAPGQQQAQHVAEIVHGVRQQGHGASKQAETDLYRDQRGVQPDAHGKRRVMPGRRRHVGVAVMVPVVMRHGVLL